MTATPLTWAALLDATERASDRLLRSQDPAGYWHSGQVPQVGLDAEDLLLREFAGIRTGEVTEGGACWIRSRQDPGGGWAAEQGGSPDLSVSVLAYAALRLAGDSPDAYHMAMAAGWIRDAGGLAMAGLRARVWLALFGLARWEELPVPPPEAILLPTAIRRRLPHQAGWSMPTVVPLSVLAALRPARRLPFSLPELRGQAAAQAGARPRPGSGLQDVPTRAAALRRCGEWILAAQRPDGSWPEGGLGWPLSLVALRLLGYSLHHPAVARGLAGLDARALWMRATAGPARRLDATGPAVLTTAQAVLALADAGVPAGDDALVSAGRWLLAAEMTVRARWLAGHRGQPDASAPADTGLSPSLMQASVGGIAEAAAVIRGLRRVRLPDRLGQRPALLCSLEWLASVQDGDGGWGSRRSPVPGSAWLTSQAVLALAAGGQPGSRAIRGGVVWLLRGQLADGSWPGGGGADELAATCAALPALVTAGVVATKPPVRRAVDWLERRQHPDGGWGADGPAPAQTARGILALLAAGDPAVSAAVERGAAWLARAQRPDGGWDGPWPERGPEGLALPLSALARYRSVVTRPDAGQLGPSGQRGLVAQPAGAVPGG